jgi:murein DD-endopeptidase MepM/ murein hydrolase activator NlpD
VRTRAWAWLACACVLVAGEPRAATSEQVALSPSSADAVALAVARALADGNYAAAHARFDGALGKQMGPADVARLLEPRRRARAPLTSLRIRDRRADAGGTTLTVQCSWSRGGASELQLTVRRDGVVTQLLSWDDDDPVDHYAPKTTLRPPFRGAWTAANAARDVENHHYANPSLRFAIDWVIRDSHGKTFRTNGKTNRDYYAYEQPVLAPAPGTVVTVVDGVPENPMPGQVDEYDAPGNYVVLDIGHDEYAMLMHLKAGAMRVHRGERVRAGQPLGRVGNSGHCTEPNLQFQIADRARLAGARSLPTEFVRVLLDGEQAERVRPVYGNIVAPAERWDPHGPMHEDDDD